MTATFVRAATAADVAAIARIHADSWRRHYRGVYSDRYLDTDLEVERTAVWSDRFGTSGDDSFTSVATRGEAVIGFVHLRFDHDPAWGTLLDNLHVTNGDRNRGIGTQLLGAVVGAFAGRSCSKLYLWVQEKNVAAQGFYAARGGRVVERTLVPPPKGDPRNLDGRPFRLRVAWPDSANLLAACR